MVEQAKLCIICGLQELETGSICPACAEGVKREALGKQANLKQQAEREIRRQGVNPDQGKRSERP
jgi:hypothetical protein